MLKNEEEKEPDRFRLYPHVRNQWTTFAFVECKPPGELRGLYETSTSSESINRLTAYLWFTQTVDCQLIENLVSGIEDKKFLNLIEDSHLSLVRGHFAVSHHHIKPLVDLIRDGTSAYHQFTVCLSDLVLFKNENESKCFLCLVDTNDPKLDLNKFGLCKAIRDSFLQFDFSNSLNSTEEFSFHLSVAWCESRFEQQLTELIDELKRQETLQPALIRVNEFKVSIGNQEHRFYLKEN